MKQRKESSERTTTAEALLGLLSTGAMSGYEVRQRIERSTGNFWRESYGQIYPTLKRMVQDGLAEVSEERPKAGASRKVYRLTAEGRKRLQAWLKTQSAAQVPRNEMLLKIFFAAQGGGPVVVKRQVEEFRELHARELERYAGIRAWLEQEHGRHPELPYWLMTLEYGRMESEANVRWAAWTLEQVKRMEEGKDDA